MMKMKSLLAVALLTAGVTGCSTLEKVVYRIDVPQGNYLEQSKVDQLQVGMTKEQVQYLLGTPLLQDPFNQTRWDYVFIKRKGHEDPIQRTLLVYFGENGLVSDIQLDKPLQETKEDLTAEEVKEEVEKAKNQAEDAVDNAKETVEEAQQIAQ